MLAQRGGIHDHRGFFFDQVRKTRFDGKLRQSQLDGLNAILDAWDKDYWNRTVIPALSRHPFTHRTCVCAIGPGHGPGRRPTFDRPG